MPGLGHEPRQLTVDVKRPGIRLAACGAPSRTWSTMGETAKGTFGVDVRGSGFVATGFRSPSTVSRSAQRRRVLRVG
jgi:hypothetical protein